MKYIQRSLSPHTRMPLGQHNPLQALGFLLDTRDLIHQCDSTLAKSFSKRASFFISFTQSSIMKNSTDVF
eukprot:COSAG02_NODE_1792_length_10916_cov_169.572789_15_plen_70_part_00